MPVVVGETDNLLSVDAISADDVIATGRYYQGDGCRVQTLHWDGVSWTRQDDGPLADIRRASASSPEDAWAIGTETCTYKPAILQHWDGSTWQRKTIPGVPDDASMNAVEARSPTDAWVGGATTEGGWLEHWNGIDWSPADVGKITSITHVSVDAANDGWLTGSTPSARGTAVQRWDGTSWTRARSPAGKSGTWMLDILAVTPNDAWACGYRRIDATKEQVFSLRHWDGVRWKTVRL